jgi:hypothetical protein
MAALDGPERIILRLKRPVQGRAVEDALIDRQSMETDLEKRRRLVVSGCWGEAGASLQLPDLRR